MKTKTVMVDEHHLLEFETPKDGAGQYLDTDVYLNRLYLCTITFADIDKFANELKDVISRYRI
jgi:hypothetical protein